MKLALAKETMKAPSCRDLRCTKCDVLLEWVSDEEVVEKPKKLSGNMNWQKCPGCGNAIVAR
ncbi:MAG: hypothetical protein Q7T50_06105 [Candidatus Magasanikbacteria bacterium]|nr:hypothetical protein [Candidatus Magasanikbacteria bacterium]